MFKAADSSSSSVLYVGRHTMVRAPFVDELRKSIEAICALMRTEHGPKQEGEKDGYMVPIDYETPTFSDPELGKFARSIKGLYSNCPDLGGVSEVVVVALVLKHQLVDLADEIRAVLAYKLSPLNNKAVLQCDLVRTEGTVKRVEGIADNFGAVESANLAHALALTARNALVCRAVPGDFDPNNLLSDFQVRAHRSPVDLATLSLAHLPVDTATGTLGSDKAFHAHLLRSVGYTVNR